MIRSHAPIVRFDVGGALGTDRTFRVAGMGVGTETLKGPGCLTPEA